MPNNRSQTMVIYPLGDAKLFLARFFWVAVVSLSLVVVLISLPVRFDDYLAGEQAQGSLDIIVDYDLLGLSQVAVARYFIFLDALPLVILITLGILIFWRNNSDGMAIFMSVGVVTVSIFFTAINWSFTNHYPQFTVPVQFPSWVGSICLLTFLFIFPDGRFIPGWGKWILIPYSLYELYRNILIKMIPDHILPPSLEYFIFLCFLLVGIGAQFVRYRYHSTPAGQQQTKLIILGMAIQIVNLLLLLFIQTVVEIPYVRETMSLQNLSIFGLFVSPILYNVFGFVTSMALGFAILRYRLWDVDVVINRSLVYGSVAMVVILIFFAITSILQIAFGNTNPQFALLASGVISAGVFIPVRNVSQHLIDRHIYGLRFDLNQLAQAQATAKIENPGKLTGTTIGKYEVHGVIGKGGMGEVYEGFCDGQRVAIKTLLPEIIKNKEQLERFEREIEAGSSLKHQNIAEVLGSGDFEGIPYLVMQYIDGQALSDLLKAQGALDEPVALRVIQDICSALEVAHDNGYVHRDIKPGNIIVRENGNAVLVDFGISKVQGAYTLTSTGAVGTIQYMAPEQIVSAKDVDHRADIYALGCVLYQILVGQPPFSGTAAQVMFGHIQQPAPDPKDIRPHLRDSLAWATLQALEKDPDNRFDSVSEFAAALQ